mgnify:CR=1 FL=1
MNINISQLSQTPIYEQIEDQIRQQILSGEMTPGEMLPSIRKTAKDLGVGIITVKRAYDDLCIEGLLISIQGRGVFVAQMDVSKARNVRIEQLDEKLSEVKAFCDTSSITKEELMKEIEKIWNN